MSAINCAAMMLFVLGADANAEKPKFSIGDPAPKIQVKEFLQGEKVGDFEKGKTYVVEFWATWCGPCIASIPHLSELQQKNKDVIFISVSIDDDLEDVREFLKKQGSKMKYRVAYDKREADAVEGAMAKDWLAGSGQDGIPASFIVNGEGKIAWIGHPHEIGEPLSLMAAGKWDIAAAKKKYETERAMADRMVLIDHDLGDAVKRRDTQKAFAIVEDAGKDFPELEARYEWTRLSLLLLLKDSQRSEKLVKSLFETNRENFNELVTIVNSILNPNEMLAMSLDMDVPPIKNYQIDKNLTKILVEITEQVEKLANHDADPKAKKMALSMLAKAYQANGQSSKAVKVLESHAEAIKSEIEEMQSELEDINKELKELQSEKKEDRK